MLTATHDPSALGVLWISPFSKKQRNNYNVNDGEETRHASFSNSDDYYEASDGFEDDMQKTAEGEDQQFMDPEYRAQLIRYHKEAFHKAFAPYYE